MSVEDVVAKARRLYSEARQGLQENDERRVCNAAFRLATLVIEEGPRIALALGRELETDADLLAQSLVLRIEQVREEGLNKQECIEIADAAWRLLERILGGLAERES